MQKYRSVLIKKNIIWSFLLKGCSGLVQLLLVPVTLFCLGNYENGIWMTISSLLVWIDSFDIGLGNGMRNRLTQQLAHNDIVKARATISSVYGMLAIIIIPVTILLLLFVNGIDLNVALNVGVSKVRNLKEVFSLSLVFVALTFVFKTIGNVYMALQLPAVNNALVVAGQVMVLATMLMLRSLNIHSLMLTSVAYTLSPLIIYTIAFPITFYIKYPSLKPSVRLFNWQDICSLLKSGVKFFALQICGAVLFMSSNFIISKLFSPDYVTPYQIAYKYFSIIIIIFTIVVTPYWSATTEAYERKDFTWISQSMEKIRRVVFLLILALMLMVILSKPIYCLWVGSDVHISLSMSVLMAVYVFIIIYSMSYSYILNGMTILCLQLICTIVAALAYIPLAILLSYSLGVNGILLALIIVNMPGLIVNKIQYTKVISGKAKGIWIK